MTDMIIEEPEIQNNPFKQIFDAAVEAVIAANKEGEILLSNPAATRLFGYSSQEFLKIKVEDLIPEELRKKHLEYRKEYNKAPEPRTMGKGRYLVARKKDKTIFPIEVSLSNTVIDDQPVTVAYIIDISKRIEIEDQIREEKKTAQTYLDVAGAIFIVINKDEEITMINRAGLKLLGYPEDEIVGKNWFNNFVPSFRRDKARAIFKRIMQSQMIAHNAEDYVIDVNGKNRIIAWHFALLGNEDDKSKSLIGSGIDITARKNAENALKKSEEKLIIYATQLEKKVEERTKDLDKAVEELKIANEELESEIKIRKQAEEETRVALAKEKELNELKSRFVSMASHEFRTPLSTILSSASLITKYTKEDQQVNRTKHTNRIKSNVGNLTNLLNDFLSLEKLEKGKVSARIRSFDLTALVMEVVDDMNSQLKDGQEITFEPDENIGMVELDDQMIKNILNNLISNAIKYSGPHGQILLNVNLKDSSQIMIKIVDEGIGIPEKEQKHLFERFFRAKNASNIQGTGLGLYIVKKYVEELGGSITFTSNLDKGTTFEITLPTSYAEDSID